MSYPKITFKDGHSAPGITFGAGTAHHRTNCVEEVKTALTAGFTSLDLAEIYGTSQYVGQAIKESGIDRSSLFSESPSLYPSRPRFYNHPLLSQSPRKLVKAWWT